MSYAWIIDQDHLPDEREPEGTNSNAKGVTGPRDAPDWMCAALESHTRRPTDKITVASKTQFTAGGPPPVQLTGSVFTFKMYDDDGELYYTGRLIVDADEADKLRDGTPTVSEQACYAPLADFGRPNAGAVSITYPGHRDMDCG